MAEEADQVRRVVAPLAADRDVDVVDVVVRGRGAGRVVRVAVDRKGGVDLATCQDLSRALSTALDADGEIEDRYVLEVTSPGVDHPLRDRAAFDRVEGRSVLIRRQTADEATVEVRGTVVRAEAEAVVLDSDSDEVRVAYADIVSAKQTLPW